MSDMDARLAHHQREVEAVRASMLLSGSPTERHNSYPRRDRRVTDTQSTSLTASFAAVPRRPMTADEAARAFLNAAVSTQLGAGDA